MNRGRADSATAVDPNQERIVLTREDALSPEIDDRLRRLRSLTGEPGGGPVVDGVRWYLQSWFLFAVAGALGALGAWAVLEPFHGEYLYIQGEVEAIELEAPNPPTVEIGRSRVELEDLGHGWLRIRGQRVWLSWRVQEYRQGRTASFDPAELEPGRQIGLYVEYFEMTDFEGVAFAHYVVLDPPDPGPAKARLELAELSRRDKLASLLFFPLVAGAIGLALGSAEGLVCRQPWRAARAGGIGLVVGLLGGFLINTPASLVFNSLLGFRTAPSSGDSGYAVLLLARAVAWGLTGTAMGLGQGIAFKSRRLLLYGLLGGVAGGTLGGLLFDPISISIRGGDHPSGHLSRLVAITVLGACVGLAIGLVQLMARDAWLRMIEGPLAGKEFLLFKDRMLIGSSRECELYLFNDPHVVPKHAVLRSVGEGWEIESLEHDKPVLVNRRAARRGAVRHGDQITIGRTRFLIQVKEG